MILKKRKEKEKARYTMYSKQLFKSRTITVYLNHCHDKIFVMLYTQDRHDEHYEGA